MVEDSRKVLLEALVEYWQDMIEANKLRVAATENDRMLMELKRAERDCRKFCAQ